VQGQVGRVPGEKVQLGHQVPNRRISRPRQIPTIKDFLADNS
jgi:hypothetical protein